MGIIIKWKIKEHIETFKLLGITINPDKALLVGKNPISITITISNTATTTTTSTLVLSNTLRLLRDQHTRIVYHLQQKLVSFPIKQNPFDVSWNGKWIVKALAQDSCSSIVQASMNWVGRSSTSNSSASPCKAKVPTFPARQHPATILTLNFSLNIYVEPDDGGNVVSSVATVVVVLEEPVVNSGGARNYDSEGIHTKCKTIDI